MSEESIALTEQSSRDAKYQSIRNFYLTYPKVNALRSELMVRYTLLEDSKEIFASKYKLYPPTGEGLKAELERERKMLEVEKRLGGNKE
jgi:hypothetical protein